MTEHLNPNAELRRALSQKGITSGLKLAKYLGSPGVIFFVRGESWGDARAELRLLKEGEIHTFHVLPEDERVREDCVDRAVDAARGLTGVYEWSKAPFSNCWLPSELVEELHEDFERGELPQSA